MATRLQFNIDPYEGKSTGWPIITIAAIVLIVFTGLPLAVKVISLIILGLMAFTTGMSLFGRALALKKGQWAKLHYPLMVRYAKVLGRTQAVKASSPMSHEAFLSGSPVYASRLLMNDAVGDESVANELFESMKDRVKKFTDKKTIEAFMRGSNPDITKSQMQEVLDEAKSTLMLENPHFVIAELVAAAYGEQERDKYVIAILTGAAS